MIKRAVNYGSFVLLYIDFFPMERYNIRRIKCITE